MKLNPLVYTIEVDSDFSFASNKPYQFFLLKNKLGLIYQKQQQVKLHGYNLSTDRDIILPDYTVMREKIVVHENITKKQYLQSTQEVPV